MLRNNGHVVYEPRIYNFLSSIHWSVQYIYCHTRAPRISNIIIRGIHCTMDSACYPLDSDFLSCLKKAFKCDKTKYALAKL